MTSTTPAASNDNKTFTLDPASALANVGDKDPFIIKVTTGAKDPSGNRLNGGSSDNTSLFETD